MKLATFDSLGFDSLTLDNLGSGKVWGGGLTSGPPSATIQQFEGSMPRGGRGQVFWVLHLNFIPAHSQAHFDVQDRHVFQGKEKFRRFARSRSGGIHPTPPR